MDGMQLSSTRDAHGRFVPGRSGNPCGKKPGTRNRATLLREALEEGEDIAAARIVIDKALAGDQVAARFVVGRLMPRPRPRDREIELDLPEGGTAADVLAGFDTTLAAMARGEITPDEALTVTRILDGKLRAPKAAARERKLSPPHRKEPTPAAKTEPSPACGRGQGEGSGAPAAQDLHGRSAQPSPQSSPTCSRRGSATPDATAGTGGPRESGRGGYSRAGRAMGDHLHSACILQSPGSGDAFSGWSVPAASRAIPVPADSCSAGIPG
jgi:hypothetical protein